MDRAHRRVLVEWTRLAQSPAYVPCLCKVVPEHQISIKVKSSQGNNRLDVYGSLS